MKHPTPFFRRTLRLLEDARDQWQALCSRIKAPRDKATLARKLEVEHSVTQGLITQLIQTQNERTYYKTDLTRTQAQLATCARERDAFASDMAHRAHVEQELIRQCDQLRTDLMDCRGQQELLLKSRTDFTQVADRVTHLTVPMRLPALVQSTVRVEGQIVYSIAPIEGTTPPMWWKKKIATFEDTQDANWYGAVLSRLANTDAPTT